jgi:hypothetical protein
MRCLKAFAVGVVCVVSLSACSDSPAPPAIAPGEVLPPNEPRSFELSIHCGAGFLSEKFNGKWWRTSEASDTGDWLPAEWSSPQNGSRISVVLVLNSGGDELTLTRLGRAVVYAPTELTEADLCA